MGIGIESTLQQKHSTYRAFIFSIYLLTCHGNFVDLRSGRVFLSFIEYRHIGDSFGSSNKKNSLPADAHSPERGLFLLRKNQSSYKALLSLRTAVVAHGGAVVALIPDATLLVSAPTGVVAALASGEGALLMAEYAPGLKLSPEVQAVLQAAAPARRRRRQMRRVQLRRQRQRLLQDTNREEAQQPAEVSTSVLDLLQTWSMRKTYGYDVLAEASTAPQSSPGGDVGTGNTASDNVNRARGGLRRPGDRVLSAAGMLPKAPPQQWLLDPASVSDAPGGAPFGEWQHPGLDLFGINVHLIDPDPMDIADPTPQTASITGWQAALAESLDRAEPGDSCRPQLAAEVAVPSPPDGVAAGSASVQVYLCAEDLEDGVSWLAAQPLVTWISPLVAPAVQNAAAGWIVQTGDISESQYDNPYAVLKPYWRAGIQGQNVVVGVADTGIDVGHCSFLDDNYSTEHLRDSLSGVPLGWVLSDHRKIVQYILAAGSPTFFGDDESGTTGGIAGHGTHVAGTVAGSIPRPGGGGAASFRDGPATGAAPLARLSVIDLAAPGALSLYLQNLLPLETQMLQRHQDVGARISSDSWIIHGAAAGAIDDVYALGFDTFAWRNPGFVSLVAAGNFGRNGRMQTTIVSPATAKNVITVGATLNHPAATSSFGDEQLYLFRYYDGDGQLQFMAIWPQGGSSAVEWQELLRPNGGDAAAQAVPVVLADPWDACTSLRGILYNGAIVVVNLGPAKGFDGPLAVGVACTVATRAKNVARAGAAGVLYMAAQAGFVVGPASTPLPNISSPLPYTFITRELGTWMADVLSDGSNSNAHMVYMHHPELFAGVDSIAAFSGYGPLPDGRIKPDLVAPGCPVTSSRASPQLLTNVTSESCSMETVIWMGTSMATPQVAGHLALMQQYFRDGYYPVGNKDSPEAVPLEPSGMLLKAVAVAGAVSLQGGLALATAAVMGPAPDGFQGWGRLSLSGALPLPNLTSPHVRLQVADLGTIEHGQEVTLRGLRATGTGPVIATLVWHDYPSAPMSGGRALLNDLDLRYSVNGGPWLATREDHVNNVERAELRGLVAGDNISFAVQGTSIVHRLLSAPDSQLPQRWALAVVGHFVGVLITPLNPSYTVPQRLPVFASVTSLPAMINSTTTGDEAASSGRHNTTEWLVAVKDACVGVHGATVVASTTCNDPRVAFVFSEATDNATFGRFYEVRDQEGRCWTLNEMAGALSLTNCTAAANQLFALFRNPYTNVSRYQLAPTSTLNRTSGSRLCLRPGLPKQPHPHFPPRAPGGQLAATGVSTGGTSNTAGNNCSTDAAISSKSSACVGNFDNTSSSINSSGDIGDSRGSDESSGASNDRGIISGDAGRDGSSSRVLTLAACDYGDDDQAFELSHLSYGVAAQGASGTVINAQSPPPGIPPPHPSPASSLDQPVPIRPTPWLYFLFLLVPAGLGCALWALLLHRRAQTARQPPAHDPSCSDGNSGIYSGSGSGVAATVCIATSPSSKVFPKAFSAPPSPRLKEMRTSSNGLLTDPSAESSRNTATSMAWGSIMTPTAIGPALLPQTQPPLPNGTGVATQRPGSAANPTSRSFYRYGSRFASRASSMQSMVSARDLRVQISGLAASRGRSSVASVLADDDDNGQGWGEGESLPSHGLHQPEM